MPLERLTMLVIPTADAAPLTLVAPRLEATPARNCPAAATGAVEVVTWEETEDPMALVAARLGDGPGPRRARRARGRRLGRAARGLRPGPPARAPERPVLARLERPPPPADAQGPATAAQARPRPLRMGQYSCPRPCVLTPAKQVAGQPRRHRRRSSHALRIRFQPGVRARLPTLQAIRTGAMSPGSPRAAGRRSQSDSKVR